MKKITRSCFLWLLISMTSSSCKKAPETVTQALAGASYPIFGAVSNTASVVTLGHRLAAGRAYFEVITLNSLHDATSAPPTFLIIADDNLVREMIASELAQQSQNPARLNIPLFFQRNEQFTSVEVGENGRVKQIERVGLQNIKVVGRSNH